MASVRTIDGVAAVRDGAHIAYTLHESAADGIPFALTHSLAMTRDFWQPVAAILVKSAPVLTYDCRGHGASDKTAGPYTVELFADDLADLLDVVRLPRAVIAGASMGGGISLAFAARHTARTAALGLIDTTAWYGPQAPRDWQDRLERARINGLASLVDFQKTRWFTEAFREAHPDVVKACVDTFLANDLDAYAETCRMLGACDLRSALPKLRMPTAILVGEEDYATPIAAARELEKAIAGSTLKVIERARHFTPLEHPEVVAATLQDLMQRVA